MALDPTQAIAAVEAAGPVAFWDFQEPEGSARRSAGSSAYELIERGGVVERADDGVFGPHAARFGAGPWLEIERGKCGALNIHGRNARLTVIAWIRRDTDLAPHPACEAVAGMWNEHAKRQYCLFLNLRIHDSSQQVGGHVSGIGGPTPGYKYCMDAAIGATPVDDRWHCAAMTYDGELARVYLDGLLDARGDRNPYRYTEGIFDSGGANFTVGAVARPERVEMVNGQPREIGHVQSNLYKGLLGGLAVYQRALSDEELRAIAIATLPKR
jgi:hypothetical protein